MSRKDIPFAVDTVKGSQFKQPLLEYSGACAGCVETAYARLITQLFGDRMYIANATGCSSIWGGSAPAMPYTVNKDGKGPAWANSLFEDNAEYGLGIATAVRQLRERLKSKIEAYAPVTKNAERKALLEAWLENYSDAEKTKEISAKLIPSLESGAANGCEYCKDIVKYKDFLVKKTTWIFGGDGLGL